MKKRSQYKTVEVTDEYKTATKQCQDCHETVRRRNVTASHWKEVPFRCMPCRSQEWRLRAKARDLLGLYVWRVGPDVWGSGR